MATSSGRSRIELSASVGLGGQGAGGKEEVLGIREVGVGEQPAYATRLGLRHPDSDLARDGGI